MPAKLPAALRVLVVANKTMKLFFAEIFGTFALVFCGTGAIVINNATGAITHLGIALTFGMIVTAMIYSLGSVSGAHMNPAVTIALWVSKKFKKKLVAMYIVAQIAGACLASLLLQQLFPSDQLLGATVPKGSEVQSLILETVLSFLLMFVIFNSTDTKAHAKFAGLAIGATVALEALFAGPICGASMNPARSLAPAVVSGHTEHLWLYIVGPMAGTVLAALTQLAFEKGESLGD